ncbi:uncharacterized protein [Globicephala melas]|uniref:uncharacterized protein isoform X1 n=1 Tax=Globicephala melas TaxID=9731 RepID=UPI00122F83A1|nr:uncharacterized protein LOC115857155 isoform X3 [Globicephala melas]XP_030719810.1 uncharacterized protein LOC115857155 isoform X3 [Globicephala melas]XP_060154963.1 uncharacterized protein LOC115857155 isoform X1 [Globicephala melas]XP_060154964.1 uncharacterized protein LOC115857155 isoform X1 [Globicephala melas]XP_060154965.1 uncharacterized protein LOC115857155 isoform X1 [Globicephala melas]
MSLTWSGDRSREEGGKWTDPISTCSRQPIDFQKDKGITSILQGYTGSFEALTFKVSKEGAEMHVSRSHQAAEELRGQHCRGAAARAPLAAPGALGLLPRAGGVTGAARTLAGGHGAVRAPSWVSASILWPPGFEGQARLPRWQMLFPRFMPSQVLEPSCCSGLGCGGPRMQLQPGNRAGNTRDGRFLRRSATGVQRFKSPLTLLDRRL